MTGIIQTLNNFKNYLVNSFTPGGDRQQQQQGGVNFGPGGERARLLQPGSQFSRLFSFGTTGGGETGETAGNRKRPAERLIEHELEITDDEDEEDCPSWSGWRRKNHLNQHQPKRFRPLEEELKEINDMSEENRRIVTRGSGLSPTIQGLVKQPWQFNFNYKRKSKPHDRNESSASVEMSRGSLLKDAIPSTSNSYQSSQNTRRRSADQSQSHVGSSLTRQLCTDMRNFQFNKPQKKEIEVVTLDDDDDDDESKKKDNNRKAGPFSRPPDQNDLKKKVKSPMKNKKVSKPFSKFISCLGRKAVDPMSSTIRLEERNRYAELIKSFDIKTKFGFGSTALQRSKINKEDTVAMYNKFTDASPTVTFRNFNATFPSPISSSTPKLLDRLAIENNRRLFSPSVPKNLAIQMKPPVIDLEKEDKDKFVNGLSPSSPSTSVEGSVDLPLHTSYVDLDDALNSGLRPTSAQPESEKKDDNLELMSETSSKADDDSDIAIVSEHILNKHRGRRLNSLALEQNLSPYVSKGWLDNLSSSYRENQRARDKQIREHLETIDVIQKESTLETDLRERMRKKLTLTEIIVLEEPIPELPEITPVMREVINLAKRPGRENDILGTVFNIDITRGDIKTLAPCKWLNDNVINIYMELIANRSKEISSYPKVHVFTTFFYPKLLKEGYSNTLKRWTRKVDIFAHDLCIFPIHLGLHWCLACADFRDKSLKYYDSLGGNNDKCLKALLNYLASEKKERKGEILERDEWELENVEEIPMQQNGSDCGVFSCKFAEYLSRDAKLTFMQENMNYYRERMIYEIIKKDLLHP